MSQLRIFDATVPERDLVTSTDPAQIAGLLGDIGVRFERWEADREIHPGDSPEEVIDAYRADLDRLMQSEGYVTVDAISLSPDHPDKAALREKFLSEHTHGEDEVRFFVAGCGLFSLHVDGKVFELLCEAGDLIGIPAGTRHWFDMGPNPDFVALRLFNNPEGWVARFTGSDIAKRFNRLEN